MKNVIGRRMNIWENTWHVMETANKMHGEYSGTCEATLGWRVGDLVDENQEGGWGKILK